ncbi:MAG: polysaccharide deacetylase family protein [Pseudomonadota bacterium]
MRISWAINAIAALAIATVGNFTTINSAEAAYCKGGDKIGVSRTVTLSTKGGKRFGSSHGGHKSFLKDKEVVLTFDDGPIPATTNKILHELDRHCAKATFFMVGQMAKNNPKMVRKVLNKGHTVGVHTYSHRNLGQTNNKIAIQEVDRSIRAVKKAAGRDVAAFFRFPYLSENRAVNSYLKKRDYGVFAIDVDSLDYKFSNSGSMVNRVMSELKRKGRGIILLHDIKKVTARGIDELLTRLNDNGYKIVHIKGRKGKSAPEPFVVAEKEIEPIKRWALKPAIGVSFASSGELTSTFKRPKMSRKRSEKKSIKLASLSHSKKKKKTIRAFANKVNLKKRSFRKAMKLRLTIQ